MNEANPTQKLGKYMLGGAWVVILAILIAFFNDWGEKQANPNRSPEARSGGGINEVTLYRNRQHQYLADGEINGMPVTFMVDTGASAVAVPPITAERLGLVKGRKNFAHTANGVTEIFITQIESLSLGTIELNDVPAGITMGMGEGLVLLGMSALRNIEFTHRDGVLTLKQYR